MNTTNSQIDRFVREAECKHLTGLSRTTRYEMEQEDKFPKRIKLNTRTVAWRLSVFWSTPAGHFS